MLLLLFRRRLNTLSLSSTKGCGGSNDIMSDRLQRIAKLKDSAGFVQDSAGFLQDSGGFLLDFLRFLQDYPGFL